MLLIGLTGGIGSGKTEVGRLLNSRGAIVIDADQIVRQLQQPGTEIFAKIIELFGQQVVTESGTLDRPAIAAAVFQDKSKLTQLNALIHPQVRIEMDRQVELHRGTDAIVILDIPLLVENPRPGLNGVLVVDLDPKIAIERLVIQRQMSRESAQARINAQVTREQRRAVADFIIDNSGDRQALADQVDLAWAWIESLNG